MLHSGLSKSQPLPLLAGASSPRRALLAGLLRAGYFSKSATSSPALRPSATRASTRAATTPRDPSRFGLVHRVSFSTAPDGSDSVGSGGRSLPWLAAGSVDSGVPTARTSAGRSSSWESSADKFFSKGDHSARVETLEDSVSYKEGGIGGEENEPIDNPKWGRIKDISSGETRQRMKGPQEDRGERFRGERFNQPDVRRWNKQEDWGRKTWKEVGESTVPKMVGEGVYGVGPVLAALTAGRREFYALYTQEGMDLSRSNKKKKDKRGIEKVLLMAETIGLKVIEASKHDLNMVVDNRPHQGLVLDASPLEMVNTKELERVRVHGGKAPVWIALDEVMDPQNLGAIIRSAYFFGAEGVVLCAKNSAPLSGVVSKASAGSLELIELLSCRNMMQFLSSSAENGWRVLGGTVAPKAIPLSEVTTGEPTILVLGSEGTGLRPLVERSCTHLVKIAGNADGFVVEEEIDATDADIGEEGDNYSGSQDMKSFLAVESLNVSVAAGVLLYHLAGKNVHPVT
uniref:rRNA methyltransferase 1, mitochondrial n=1 Tax=Aegilops tauschii subsp. strangulata TaxID=200361 RepID=A0A453FFE7_AEGTS